MTKIDAREHLLLCIGIYLIFKPIAEGYSLTMDYELKDTAQTNHQVTCDEELTAEHNVKRLVLRVDERKNFDCYCLLFPVSSLGLAANSSLSVLFLPHGVYESKAAKLAILNVNNFSQQIKFEFKDNDPPVFTFDQRYRKMVRNYSGASIIVKAENMLVNFKCDTGGYPQGHGTMLPPTAKARKLSSQKTTSSPNLRYKESTADDCTGVEDINVPSSSDDTVTEYAEINLRSLSPITQPKPTEDESAQALVYADLAFGSEEQQTKLIEQGVDDNDLSPMYAKPIKKSKRVGLA